MELDFERPRNPTTVAQAPSLERIWKFHVKVATCRADGQEQAAVRDGRESRRVLDFSLPALALPNFSIPKPRVPPRSRVAYRLAPVTARSMCLLRPWHMNGRHGWPARPPRASRCAEILSALRIRGTTCVLVADAPLHGFLGKIHDCRILLKKNTILIGFRPRPICRRPGWRVIFSRHGR